MNRERDTQMLRRDSVFPNPLLGSLSTFGLEGKRNLGSAQVAQEEEKRTQPQCGHHLPSASTLPGSLGTLGPPWPSGIPDPCPAAHPTRTHLGSCCPRWRRAHRAGATDRTAARGAGPCGRAGRGPSPGCRRGWSAPSAARGPASAAAAASRPPAPGPQRRAAAWTAGSTRLRLRAGGRAERPKRQRLGANCLPLRPAAPRRPGTRREPGKGAVGLDGGGHTGGAERGGAGGAARPGAGRGDEKCRCGRPAGSEAPRIPKAGAPGAPGAFPAQQHGLLRSDGL